MTNTSAVNPSEVGWQFVPQYYTFVNKQPNRLHCFYTKASTFIHGTEGEDGKPCYGQQVSSFVFLSSSSDASRNDGIQYMLRRHAVHCAVFPSLSYVFSVIVATSPANARRVEKCFSDVLFSYGIT